MSGEDYDDPNGPVVWLEMRWKLKHVTLEELKNHNSMRCVEVGGLNLYEIKVLQQKVVDDYGKVVWRDIPIVGVEEE
jgi:hypothetical protein